MFTSWPHSIGVIDTLETVLSTQVGVNAAILFVSIQNTGATSATASVYVTINGTDYCIHTASLYEQGSDSGPSSSQVALKVIVPPEGVLKVEASSTDVDFIFSGEEYFVDETAEFPGVYVMPTNEALAAGLGAGAEIYDDVNNRLIIMTEGEGYIYSSFEPRLFLETQLVAISAGGAHTVGLKPDGTCVATGTSTYIDGVTDWTDIVALAAGGAHTVGLKSDGTCVATGNSTYIDGVTDWTDIVALAAGNAHTVGLKSDGSCVATGNSTYIDGVTDWIDIVAISAGSRQTVGLKPDGTCVATGEYTSGMTGWTNIVALSAGIQQTVGLKSDGTCVATGTSSAYSGMTDWTDIVAITAATGTLWAIGLKSDGTCVVAGRDNISSVANWTDIVAISAGGEHSVGLKSDGSCVGLGVSSNISGVTGWTLFNIPRPTLP